MMLDQKTTKQLSREHELIVAQNYKGVRSPSSGAQDHDKGDVRSKWDNSIFECKGQNPGAKRKSSLVRYMEKIADEAWEQGRCPALNFRFWDPSSPLAEHTGWVYLTVRLMGDDVDRSEKCAR